MKAFAFVVILSLTLAACGGGGSSSSGGSTPPKPALQFDAPGATWDNVSWK